MLFYLGAHTEYRADLLDVFDLNNAAVAIIYKNNVKGVPPQNQNAFFPKNIKTYMDYHHN